jgi:type II secretory pathway component PulF
MSTLPPLPRFSSLVADLWRNGPTWEDLAMTAALAVILSALVIPIWLLVTRPAVRRGLAKAAVPALKICALIAAGIVMVFLVIVFNLLTLVLVVVALLIWSRQRVVRQQAMLGMLTLSVERSIPMAPAIAAMARERWGRAAERTRLLAASLTGGVPLVEAIASVRGVLPPMAAPLVAVGCKTGNLPAALRQAAALGVRQESLWRSLVPKLAYVCLMPAFATGMIGFFGLKIVPQMQKIFKDFHEPLPVLTQRVFGAVRIFLGPLGTVSFAVLLLLLVYVLLRYTGIIVWNLPGLGFLTRRLDRAVILDALSLAAQGQQPLLPAVEALAGSYPKPAIRRRLRSVAADLTAGVPWAESLRRRGLLGKVDQAILAAAERAGNLPWAMREAAEAGRRRFAYRTEALLQILFPLFIVAFGLVVLAVAGALFLMLASLIQTLALP